WLGRALEGPTPSSAIFYGSLMVHAGIFLLLRLEPLLKQFPILMSALVLLGGLTVLYSVWVALVQTDVKSALVLATQTQVGLMVVECGLGWFQLATWHMAAHAVWRLYQFLQAPSYMHQLTRPTRPVIPLLAVRGTWFNAALQRFWLDHLANALLVRPTYRLARDVVGFDNQVIDRLTGKPDPRTHQAISPADSDRIQPVEGWGLAGGVIAQASAACDWLENHLILPMGGQGLVHHLHRLGEVLQRLDKLLAQPRYVVLLVFLTFAVIL
ncbi:MAG: hypothetical protein G8345_20740, partial [Magnetococcales bacterium]|nr:hypothetical protein [Magnetococcales bacterium]